MALAASTPDKQISVVTLDSPISTDLRVTVCHATCIC